MYKLMLNCLLAALMNVTQQNESGGVGNQCVAFVDLHIHNFVV